MSQKIYCISGLGADHHVFKNLELNGHELKPVPWVRPEKNELIDNYARRMIECIEEPSPVILGVSFGGMMAIEIAKLINVKKLIIVSSIKSPAEMPQWMRLAGKLQLNKLLPIKSYKMTERIDNDRLGVSNEEERLLVAQYRRSADSMYMSWAVNEVLNWKNGWQPGNIVHIHGDKDKIFPVKNLKADHIIKNGTHLMVYNRAKEISELLAEVICK